MELSQLQEEILNSPDNKIIVLASAASGKTRLMTEKVRQLLNNGIDPREIAVITFTNMAAAELKQRLGDNYKPGLFVGTIHSLANYFLTAAGIKTDSILDEENFDQLFLMVKENPECVRHLEWILLDEAQDSDDLQFEFLLDMIKPECFFICGDIKQCQPAGTQVWLRDGIIKNIEDIQVGDDIIWYEPENGRCSAVNTKAYNTKHKHVLQTSNRNYNNDYLITITTKNGYKSTYTSNHRVFMSMKANTEYQHTVYLMCNENNRFRIGKIPLFGTRTANSSPWKQKMGSEGCSKIWLLKMFKTDKEARVYEQKISYKYQIPQTCWQTDKVTWTTEDIDYIYEGLDTYQNAIRCLTDHKLNYDYPMYSNKIDWLYNQKFANNAVFQIYAINIFDEIMECWTYNNQTSNHSNKIRQPFSVEKQYIDQPIKVYSLKTEGETYIADGILTHNCIYRFNGSNPDLLHDLTFDPEVYTCDLNENYRNGSAILDFARRLIKKTGLRDNSKPMRGISGVVKEAKFNERTILEYIQSRPPYSQWAILCRSNRQVEQVCWILRTHEIPYETFKQGDLKKEELVEKMKQETVKVLTVHSAKGLEWNNVIAIGMNGRNDEETCIEYVAATRAKNLLIWMK